MDEEQRRAIARQFAAEVSDWVTVYEPPLVVTLARYERGEGRPLTKEEVLRLREAGFCRVVPPAEARGIEAARGYADVDHENCWEDWQRYRRELGFC